MRRQGAVRMADQAQNFSNHTKFVPAFHFFVLPVLLINIINRLVALRHGLSYESIFAVILAIGLLMLAFTARVAALTVQDRVIRLEMQLRFASLLPPDLLARANDFTVGQLVGLRFASDEELPSLCRQVLDEKLTDRKDIKRRVKNWRPDLLRA
jgi:hypothetical protein